MRDFVRPTAALIFAAGVSLAPRVALAASGPNTVCSDDVENVRLNPEQLEKLKSIFKVGAGGAVVGAVAIGALLLAQRKPLHRRGPWTH